MLDRVLTTRFQPAEVDYYLDSLVCEREILTLCNVPPGLDIVSHRYVGPAEVRGHAARHFLVNTTFTTNSDFYDMEKEPHYPLKLVVEDGELVLDFLEFEFGRPDPKVFDPPC